MKEHRHGTSGELQKRRKYIDCQENKNPCSKVNKVLTKQDFMVLDVLYPCKPWIWWLILGLFTSISVVFHLYNIDKPDHVCWDETHFGKMASWYINNTFFVDVHPPVGKMVIMVAGVMSGYDGSFHFSQPGDKFESEVQYVGMRVMSAIYGSCLVPLAYGTVWELTNSLPSSIFAASFVLFDTGTLTLTRHILLDPFLLFYIISSVYCLTKFNNEKQKAFQTSWWFWLILTGINLAFSVGVKFVGLFVILFAGYTTAKDLWHLWGDLCLPITYILKHFIARVLCLIIVPSILYASFFAVHFKILNKSGGGDGFFSPAFQSQLIGNSLHNSSMPEVIAYGSHITVKQSCLAGGYLHSHSHLYPSEVGTVQQQVTSYSHKDENNFWIIKPYNRNLDSSEDVELVHSGDLVRLEHLSTRRNLHSHKTVAPLTATHYQITGYGENGTGDANDIFCIEIQGVERGTVLKSMQSSFKLTHFHVGCALHSNNKQLPKWGWEQMEVTCNPLTWQAKNLWHIEEVIDGRLPNVSIEVHTPSFLDKFIESHAVMRQANQGLKPKQGEVTSRPWQWPLNYQGQPFSGNGFRIYLLGNPVIWWFILIILSFLLMDYIFHATKKQRGRMHINSFYEYKEQSYAACGWLMLGWALHFLPFWPMTRVLYYHHYFPAFLFSCMAAGIALNLFINRLCWKCPQKTRYAAFNIVFGSTLCVMAFSFYAFHPLTYGMMDAGSIKNGSMAKLRWLETWDF